MNANKWAVAARGFNDLFSNKLLVLIDGRSVYTRAFLGVFWDGEDCCSTTSIGLRSFAGRAAPRGGPTPSTASSTSSRSPPAPRAASRRW